MLKSLLLKLRQKPKLVREQAALWFAGVFTAIVLILWLFTIPGRFSGPAADGPGIFSTLRDDLAEESIDLEEFSAELDELLATSTEVEALPPVIPNEFPTSTDNSVSSERRVLIATTTNQTASSTE